MKIKTIVGYAGLGLKIITGLGVFSFLQNEFLKNF